MITNIVLSSLIKNREYLKKVLPHLKEEYFETSEDKKIFKLIKEYIKTYRSIPTINTLKLELSKDDKIGEDLYNKLNNSLNEIFTFQENYDTQWLVDNTEQWCKDRAIYIAIMDSVHIIENKEQTSQIPLLMTKALQVEFDNLIGIDFLNDDGINDRWEMYQKKETKFATNIFALDAVTNGGFEAKSLSVIMGGTGIGKTAIMIALTANFLRNGKNVLYITLEMAEEKIAQRLDIVTPESIDFLDHYVYVC